MDAIRINRQAARLAALLLLGLALMGCNAKRPASTFALPVAAAPAPRTVESTLQLHPDAQEIPFNPEIAGDAYGNAIAVWEQSDGKRVNIRANRFVAGTGWGSATRIETGKSNAGEPLVAMDAEGNAIAVWYRFDGKRGQLWSNRYVAGGVWGQALLMESKPGYAHSPVIETEAGGHATVVWKQADGWLTATWAKHYRVGEGWSAARQGCSPTAHALAVPGQSEGIARPVAGDPEMKHCY